ncbi:hypothetical protein BT96DRAFT_1023345 [Gymnopus androsaceus JB14]|uniref:NACHT domain-containing protein n=1 Tax=Gymnopus androsaceus JB14 TaxID=1447944 RepID=A0A6A4H4Z7_9AGAR|nr:hypothetical protein BT96DRAFT_1023345 [Gymnopus androsaceus JB14]
MSSTNAQQASDRMAMTKDLSTDVLSVLKLAKEVTTGLGMFGIEPALNGVLAVCEMVQNMKSNKKDLPKLKEKINNFITALLLNNNNNNVPAELYKRLQNLSDALQKIAKDCTPLASKGRIRQFLQANDTKVKIEDIRQSVRDALQEFSFHGGISIQIVINDIQKRTRDTQKTGMYCLFNITNTSFHANKKDYSVKLHFLIDQLSVAPARFDAADTPSACLEGTREQLLKDLHNCALGGLGSGKQIIWIHGTPGRGKSTIAKSLAIRLHEENALAASFFFSRSHESRSNFNNVFCTIACQIAIFNQQFRNILVDILEQDDQLGHATPGIQLKKLIIDPLSKLPKIQDPWVLVFDALDECAAGTELLELLCEEIGNLPINLHIIFTSRPEHPICMWFHKDPLKSSTYVIILDDVDEGVVSKDILQYLEYNLAGDGKKAHKEPLANPEQLNLLADRAQGLFIYASTTIKHIRDQLGYPPAESIGQILKLDSGLIDDLYDHILHGLIPEGNVNLIKKYQKIMGALLHLQEPLSIPLLSKLLGYDEDVAVEAMLQRMSAVLIMPENKDDVVRIAHLSFWEYATSRGIRRVEHPKFKYRPELDLDASKHHESLLHATLSVMRAELKFNICNLESSFLANHQVENLQVLSNRYIEGHLSYSCRFWSAHLNELRTVNSISLGHDLKDFLEKRFLWWLEVISILKQVDTAALAILSIADWSKDRNDELASTALDALYPSCPMTLLESGGTLQAYISKEVISRHRPNKVVGLLFSLVLAGHAESVESVAISPDGKRVVSGSMDKTIRIWNAETGEQVVEPILGHTIGLHLLDSHQMEREDWRTSSGTNIGTYRWVTSVGFSSDGKRVVSGSMDKTIRIWNAETGEQVVEPILGHTDDVTSVGFSSDGKRVVSGSRDEDYPNLECRDWRTSSGTNIGTYRLVTSVGFSSDGKRVVSGSTIK